MGIISWIIVGLIAGALGKLVLPGDDPGGFIVTILIGMAGALVGGLLVGLLGRDRGHGVQHLVHPRSHRGGDRTACRLSALGGALASQQVSRALLRSFERGVGMP